MITYAFLSFFLAVIGIAVVVAFTAVVVQRARGRRELARRKGELPSEQALDDLLRQVDQATDAEDLDRLEEKKRDD